MKLQLLFFAFFLSISFLINAQNSGFIGPDAPDLKAISFDQKIVIVLENPEKSNNRNLDYEEEIELDFDLEGEYDMFYRFEGYQLFQLRDASIDLTLENLLNPLNARQVFQSDLQNDIVTAFNWHAVDDPYSDDTLYVPVLKVEGENIGVKQSFVFDKCAFTDSPLENGKDYYFTVLAYAYNNYLGFDIIRFPDGQKQTYLPSTRNIRTYSFTPKAILPGTKIFSDFGDPLPITRLEGQGNNYGPLIPIEGFDEKVLSGNFNGEIEYLPGFGPFEVFIANPFEVRDGTFELEFIDADPNEYVVGDEVSFKLTKLETGENYESTLTLGTNVEEMINKFGLGIRIFQADPPGANPVLVRDNGFIGGFMEYKNPYGSQWLSFVEDQTRDDNLNRDEIFDFIKTEKDNEDHQLDPNRSFIVNNETGFFPYCLCDSRPSNLPMISPAWINDANSGACGPLFGLNNLNNVDIVFTSDKSKWSRVVILEATTGFLKEGSGEGFGGSQMSLLERPAASKSAGPDGMPLDDPDLPNGFGWFPGYAIDVATGQRLNLFFSEATIYSPDNPAMEGVHSDYLVGNDRMWNPGLEIEVDGLPGSSRYFTGGHHFIYVTNQEYDGCLQIHDILSGPLPMRIKIPQVFRTVNWTVMPLASELLSYEEGLIPNDVRVQLRVTQPFSAVGSSHPNYAPFTHNKYQFSIEGMAFDPDVNLPGYEGRLIPVSLIRNPGPTLIILKANSIIDEILTVEVYDRNGLLQFTTTLTDRLTEINTSSWPSGVYIVHVYDQEGNRTTLQYVKS
ncbi:MAG: T9SS C-terminal target domain-containing protein [Saprospirales bacterium]|nr:MAG: T9SS C-terminal target domain-containing protein [Saprospirales bacterium]